MPPDSFYLTLDDAIRSFPFAPPRVSGKPYSLRRFAERIRIAPDGCWIWQASTGSHGYGQFTVDYHKDLAHRFAYLWHHGHIEKGRQHHLDHLCKNKRCVNPDHLEAVSPLVNIHRGGSRTIPNAQKTHCPTGHEYTPANTRRMPDGGRRCIACEKVQSRASRLRNIEHRRELDRQDYRRRKARAAGLSKPVPTHCPKGHEMTPENTAINDVYGARCRRCDADKARAARARTKLRNDRNAINAPAPKLPTNNV